MLELTQQSSEFSHMTSCCCTSKHSNNDSGSTAIDSLHPQTSCRDLSELASGSRHADTACSPVCKPVERVHKAWRFYALFPKSACSRSLIGSNCNVQFDGHCLIINEIEPPNTILFQRNLGGDFSICCITTKYIRHCGYVSAVKIGVDRQCSCRFKPGRIMIKDRRPLQVWCTLATGDFEALREFVFHTECATCLLPAVDRPITCNRQGNQAKFAIVTRCTHDSRRSAVSERQLVDVDLFIRVTSCHRSCEGLLIQLRAGQERLRYETGGVSLRNRHQNLSVKLHPQASVVRNKKNSSDRYVSVHLPDGMELCPLYIAMSCVTVVPVTATSSIDLTSTNQVIIQVNVVSNLGSIPFPSTMNQAMIRIPIPSSWMNFFCSCRRSFWRRPGLSKFPCCRRSCSVLNLPRDLDREKCNLQITRGSVWYELSQSAILWSLDWLTKPRKSSWTAPPAKQTLTLHLRMPFDVMRPPRFGPHVELCYSSDSTWVTGVSFDEPLMTAMNQHADCSYHYITSFIGKIFMDVLEDGKRPKPTTSANIN